MDNETKHSDDCLMCAVRALTEGNPPLWQFETYPETSGVVLKMGEVASDFGTVPFVDLWRGGDVRVRIMGYSASLRHALSAAAPQIGDTLSVWFDGVRSMPAGGKFGGREYRAFSANVQRGH